MTRHESSAYFPVCCEPQEPIDLGYHFSDTVLPKYLRHKQ